MKVKANIKTQTIVSGGKAVKTIHILASEDFTVDLGDTVILHPKKPGIIEIIKRQTTPTFPPPYYATY